MGLTKKFTLQGLDVLQVLLPVDGSGSLLDADLLDGYHAVEIIEASRASWQDLTSYTGLANAVPMGSEDGKLHTSWLPLATTAQAGAVKLGMGLVVDANGALTLAGGPGGSQTLIIAARDRNPDKPDYGAGGPAAPVNALVQSAPYTSQSPLAVEVEGMLYGAPNLTLQENGSIIVERGEER